MNLSDYLIGNTFDFEVKQIVKKIQFIKPVLQSLSVGRKVGVRNISHSCLIKFANTKKELICGSFLHLNTPIF